MFRYVLAILLASAYSGSLGVPLFANPANSPLANSLASLANRCQNVFLTEQIKSKLDECNVVVPPYNEKQFVCMMFYDINKQLCDAVAESKLILSDANKIKIDQEIDVESVCDMAKTWKVSDVAEYPEYKKKVARVFSVSIGCVKVCGVEDVISQEANFFCKYYKWGTDILQTDVANNTLEISNSNKNSTKELSKDQVPPSSGSGSSQLGQTLPKALENTNISDKFNESNVETSQNKPSVNNPVEELEAIPSDTKVSSQNAPKSSLVPVVQNVNNENDKPSESVTQTPKKLQDTVQEVVTQIQKELKLAVNQGNGDDKNKSPDQDPDYRDSEEGKDGIDGDDDNGDDPSLGGEVAIKPEQNEINNNIPKKIETPMSFNGERASRKLKKRRNKSKTKFYPNTMPEQFTEDDDHFFPLFLTGVILAVLLYVLYHNKSKVSKVFLGLIVEGRQSGRRRNSRGHAYRRLDTLEQAMNTSSAAPPSKIIY